MRSNRLGNYERKQHEFSGSGTTAFQAARMGRVGIGVELSEAYIKQAQAGRLAQSFLPMDPPAPAALRLDVAPARMLPLGLEVVP